MGGENKKQKCMWTQHSEGKWGEEPKTVWKTGCGHYDEVHRNICKYCGGEVIIKWRKE